jgi:hypothetical protein
MSLFTGGCMIVPMAGRSDNISIIVETNIAGKRAEYPYNCTTTKNLNSS